MDSVAFVRCSSCGDHRRAITGRHLSKHGIDRDTYLDEYGLSPDETIAKDVRQLQSSRPGYNAYGKREWIRAIKELQKREGDITAGRLQAEHPHFYLQGCWIFGDWDSALRAAGFDFERVGSAYEPIPAVNLICSHAYKRTQYSAPAPAAFIEPMQE